MTTQSNSNEPANPSIEEERDKPPVNVSLFELFRGAFSSRLTPLRATKLTLVDISHSLEELVIADRLPAMIFTGFQQSSYWRQETARYLNMAGIVHSVSIFAGGMPLEAPGSNYIHVNLAYDDRLRQEWFLLVLTKQFSALLCGRDRLEDAVDEAHRAFDTLWTFEPDLINDLAMLLARVIAHYRPERHQQLLDGLQQFPPCQPDARYVTLLTSRVVGHLERQYSRQQLQLAQQPDLLVREPDQDVSTALLPLFSQTYLLLLLGIVTEARIDHLANKVIADLLSFKAKHLIVEFSQAVGIEPDAARHLVQVLREVQLCGVKVVITGMHPAVAQTFINLNLDSYNLPTYTTLDEGSAAVLAQMRIAQ